MASCAARLISAGAEKSGKPCARFTASYCIACRVISRITDSVKCSTLSERKCLAWAETGVMENKASTRNGHVGTGTESDQFARPLTTKGTKESVETKSLRDTSCPCGGSCFPPPLFCEMVQ